MEPIVAEQKRRPRESEGYGPREFAYAESGVMPLRGTALARMNLVEWDGAIVGASKIWSTDPGDSRRCRLDGKMS